MSKRGKTAREKGHRWERDSANSLTEIHPQTIVSARSLSGGTQAGSDLLVKETSLPPWGIHFECKDWDRWTIREWRKQAIEQAGPDEPWALLIKEPRAPTDKANVVIPLWYLKHLLTLIHDR